MHISNASIIESAWQKYYLKDRYTLIEHSPHYVLLIHSNRTVTVYITNEYFYLSIILGIIIAHNVYSYIIHVHSYNYVATYMQ